MYIIHEKAERELGGVWGLHAACNLGFIEGAHVVVCGVVDDYLQIMKSCRFVRMSRHEDCFRFADVVGGVNDESYEPAVII